jgi:cell wall-associated NlpC family hydrolase
VRHFLLLWLLALSSFAEQPYASPYSVKFTFELEDLIGDLDGPRGHWKSEASIPFEDWYSAQTQRRFGVWGPSGQHFPPAVLGGQRTVEWMQQRVIATGLRFQGYHYQHHHVPDWDPPADWPYKPSPLGRQSKGVDCSNFTAFVYNLAFGLKPSGETREQAAMTEVRGPGPDRTSKVRRIEVPASHAEYRERLQTGDLLFIKGRTSGEITHVVIWVGGIGQSRNAVPLILDSTGEGHKDENGAQIPDGVQLRPFTPKSWYCQSASHALRLLLEGD